MDKTNAIYAYDQNSDQYVYRIPGHRHGDGQIDSDDEPLWMTCEQAEAEAACDGDVPTIKL